MSFLTLNSVEMPRMIVRSAFNHDDGVAITGDDQIEAGCLKFLRGRVEDIGAVDVADPDSGDRPRNGM